MNVDTMRERIVANHAAILDRMDGACRRAGRPSDSVRLIAVTKYARPEWVEVLVDAGILELGESRPQQLLQRADEFPSTVRWHLIGHLQRNKVRPMLPLCEMIHSVDSARLLNRIQLLAQELDLVPRVLLEVNISGEASKGGFERAELQQQFAELSRLQHVEICGPDDDGTDLRFRRGHACGLPRSA